MTRLIRSKGFEWSLKVFGALVFVWNGYNTFHEAWMFHSVFVESQDVTLLWIHFILFIVWLSLSIMQWNSYIRIGKENTVLHLRVERMRNEMLNNENAALREVNQRMESTLELVAKSFKAKEKEQQDEENIKPVVPQSNDRLGGIE